jgi:imidazolonepropionase-like amidohydrolase
MIKHILICFLLLIFFNACEPEPKKEDFDLLINNASVVDVKNGSLLEGMFLGIKGDSIHLTGKMEEAQGYSATDTLDAKHKFVMPGLWDMHVHFRGGEALIEENKDLLPLFLAFGVISVRDAGGDISPAVLEWREKIKNAELDGPRIFTSGPKLDGPAPAWPGSIRITEKEDIDPALDSLEFLGVDYVKTYDGSLSKENFYAIIKAAEERGLKTTGHMPMAASIVEAVDHGLDGTEHMYYIMTACSLVADSLRALEKGYGIMDEVIRTYDPEFAKEIFSKFSKNGKAVTPTLHIVKTLAQILEVDHTQDTLLKYMGSGIKASYERRIQAARRAVVQGDGSREKVRQQGMEMILPMYEAGMELYAGSDSGPFNSFVYPGESLHQELWNLNEAGLSPQQALITSVINGPRFFGLEDKYGSLDSGKIADILILDKNPLEDIKNTSKIYTVIKGGKVYDRETLDVMLQKLKEKNGN